jgi:hypothetical protein
MNTFRNARANLSKLGEAFQDRENPTFSLHKVGRCALCQKHNSQIQYKYLEGTYTSLWMLGRLCSTIRDKYIPTLRNVKRNFMDSNAPIAEKIIFLTGDSQWK